MDNNTNDKKIIVEKKKESIWDIVRYALIALAIVVPIRTFIAQPFVVSGLSMYPTFDDGQYLIVDEISYIRGNIHRGDVVIFKYPNDPKRYFVKRMIGLPNEKISINNGKVTIINAEHPEGFLLDESYVNEPFDTTGVYETKDDEYFVMGDNRNNSSDSRFWGVVPKKRLIGRAYLRLLPFNSVSYLPGSIENIK